MQESHIDYTKALRNNNSYQKNIYYYIYLIFFSYTALIDSVNGYSLYNYNISLGQFHRLLLLVMLMFIVLKFSTKKNALYVMILIFYSMILQFVYFFSHSSLSGLADDLIRISKVLLVIFTVEAFKKLHDNNKITNAVIIKIFDISILLFPLCLLIPKILGLGYAMYESDGVGYSGFFYAANDLNIVLLTLFVFSLDNVFNRKKKFAYYLITSFLLIISLILLGSKSSAILGIFVLVVYLLKQFFSSGIKPKIKTLMIIFFLSITSYLLVSQYYQEEVSKALGRHAYFYNNDFGNQNNISTFLLTNRNQFLDAAIESLNNDSFPLLRITFGTGFFKHISDTGEVLNLESKSIEMDFFETFFSYGIIGTLIIYTYFTSYFISAIKNKGALNNNFGWFFSFIIIALYSFFGGHVLYSALSGTILSLICCMLYGISKSFKKQSKVS